MKFALPAGVIALVLVAAYPLAGAVSANITGFYDRPKLELLPNKITSQSGAVANVIFQVEGELAQSILQHANDVGPSRFVVNYKIAIKEKQHTFSERTLQTFAFSNKAVFTPTDDSQYKSWPKLTLYDKRVLVPVTVDEARTLLFNVAYESFLPKSLFEKGPHMVFVEVTANWDSDLLGTGSVTERSFTYQLDVK